MKHVHELTAADGDIDDLGHVNNLVFLRWALDAARAHSAKLGWAREDYQRIGGVFVVRRHEIDYLRPAFAGDAIRIETWVVNMQRSSSVREYRILRGAEELAKARTTWAYVDTTRGRLARIPDEIRAAFLPAATDQQQGQPE